MKITIEIDGEKVGAADEDSGAIPSLEGVPPDTVLPLSAAQPNPPKGFKDKLAPAQLALLVAFTWLDPERKAALIHDADPKEAVSYQLIQQAVDEQVRERGLWSESAHALEDTTKSDLDEDAPDEEEDSE